MADKSTGLDFDRQVFVQPDPPKSRQAPPIVGILFALIAIAAVGFLAYKLFPQSAGDSPKTDDETLAEVNSRLAEIEKRLDRLEALRRAAVAQKKEQEGELQQGASIPREKAARPSGYSSSSTKPAQAATTPAAAGADAATTMQRLVAVQKGVAALEGDEAANREAWQATTDRMADMAGQVGTQSVEVLRDRDELNEVLANTETEAIPFELYRGANPQPVGPVSLALKSASPKHQTYTLCVYIQNSCTELKNHTLYEVVQFIVARNSVPLKVIATKLSDDEMVGYLEVPRGQEGH